MFIRLSMIYVIESFLDQESTHNFSVENFFFSFFVYNNLGKINFIFNILLKVLDFYFILSVLNYFCLLIISELLWPTHIFNKKNLILFGTDKIRSNILYLIKIKSTFIFSEIFFFILFIYVFFFFKTINSNNIKLSQKLFRKLNKFFFLKYSRII